MTARQLIYETAQSLFPEAGCCDGGCIFGHPGGMQTNGGCQCLGTRDPRELQVNLMRMRAICLRLAERIVGEVEP